MYVKISPGESVSIASMENLDLSAKEVQKLFPDCMLMGLITPTTTMMREGITQAATKIDAGFCGTLNWGLRNSSNRDLVIGYGEPIFKVTFFLLEGDESPDVPYGGRPSDAYQNSEGIVRSARRIPADLPANRVVSSSVEKLDPTRRLQEAGYPFSHIGAQLIQLHGRFEMVSRDVLLIKEDFDSRANELSKKIEVETKALSEQLGKSEFNLIERVNHMLDSKVLGMIAGVAGAVSVGYGVTTFLTQSGVPGNVVAGLAVLAGVTIWYIAYFVRRRP